MIVIRQARREDAIWLSSRLRPEDSAEIEAATGSIPQKVLPLSFDISRKCLTIWYSCMGQVDPNPLAIYGVADDPSDSTVGVVWMVATPRLSQCRISFLKTAPLLLEDLSTGYKALHNIVDVRNYLHIRWLQKTGFQQDGPSISLNGFKFIHVTRHNK